MVLALHFCPGVSWAAAQVRDDPLALGGVLAPFFLAIDDREERGDIGRIAWPELTT